MFIHLKLSPFKNNVRCFSNKFSIIQIISHNRINYRFLAIIFVYSHKKKSFYKNEDNQTNNNVTNETAARDLLIETEAWTSLKISKEEPV